MTKGNPFTQAKQVVAKHIKEVLGTPVSPQAPQPGDHMVAEGNTLTPAPYPTMVSVSIQTIRTLQRIAGMTTGVVEEHLRAAALAEAGEIYSQAYAISPTKPDPDLFIRHLARKK